MFRKSVINKIQTAGLQLNISKRLDNLKLDSNVSNGDSTFKFSELSLENILDEPDGTLINGPRLTLGLTKPTNQQKRQSFLSESNFVKMTPMKKPVPNRDATNNPKRQILFPSRKFNLVPKIFAKYIPLSSIDNFLQWNKHALKRTIVNIDDLLSRDTGAPLIKQLKPNKYQKGFDIVPIYLNKKSKKTTAAKKAAAAAEEEREYDCRAVLKAYKVFHTDTRPLFNVCLIGPRRSGKSSMLGSLLLHHGDLTPEFVKKTRWEATKAGLAAQCSISWLVDTSVSERSSHNGTIVPSSHVIQSRDTVLHVTDTPGNEAYLHETLRILATNNDCVVLVLDYEQPIHGYVARFARLCKVLSVTRLLVVLTNVRGRPLDDTGSRDSVTETLRRYGKCESRVLTINDLGSVHVTEIAAILDAIIAIGSSVSRDNHDSALRAPLLATIVDVHRAVDSSLPVLVARIMAGGLSAGLNNAQSAVAIVTSSGGVPTQHSATVKSMRVDEAGVMRSRGFAFVGDLVELTLPEIVREDSVRRGDLIRQRRHDGGVLQLDQMLARLVIVCGDEFVPLINGSVVTMWTVTRTVVATVRRIETVEYAGQTTTTTTMTMGKRKTRPRLIGSGARHATLRLTTDEPIPIQYHSDHNLHIFLLFHNSLLFAAGRFEVDDK